MHMRTTLILDDALLEKARRLSGLAEKTAVVHAGLRALIARESARRLARLGGAGPPPPPPRRPPPAPPPRFPWVSPFWLTTLLRGPPHPRGGARTAAPPPPPSSSAGLRPA